MSFLDWVKSLFSNKVEEVFPNISFNELKICCQWPDEKEQSISWNDLEKIIVATTDLGPYVEDVFYIFIGPEFSLNIPQGAEGSSELMDRAFKLPNWNSEAFINAMSSAQNNEFLCWHREKK